MGRIATSVDQQIEKLQARGMVLDLGIEKTKEVLLDIGYYRLGFYWNPFEIDADHNFEEGTKFSDVVSLYYLDVDLRNVLSKYLYRIEINFRTKLVYYASNKYKTSSTWFIDPKVMDNTFILNIKEHYTADFIKSNKTIKNHHKNNINDKYAPAWKTLEFFTFGAILKVYKSLLEDDIKERISKVYGVLNLSKFLNLMETIVYIRNVCAHGGVLFDLKTPKGISILPSLNFNNNNRHSLDSIIKIILFFLETISNDRKLELEKCLEDLFSKHKDNVVIKELIESNIGYVY